jgi:L-amino acid N-acyltransferase YncA
MELSIATMKMSDWEDVRAIYNEGIATGGATFETEAPAWEEWNDRFISSCRLVARERGQIVGWAALSPASNRHVYRGVAEASIYVTTVARGRGIGRSLLIRLIEESENAGFWTLQAGIFPENNTSLELVKGCGFRGIGCRERLGRMGAGWRDVILVERRSASSTEPLKRFAGFSGY